MKTEAFLEISGNSGIFVDYNELRAALMVFCKALDLPGNLSVSLLFCTSTEMREINRKYRGDDKTTDVLSFPSEMKVDPSLNSKVATDASSVCNTFGANVSTSCTNCERPFLGEILIDTNYIYEQTEPDMFNHAVLQVFIHGLLHLQGYDHLGFQPREEMLQMEKKIMDLIKQEG